MTNKNFDAMTRDELRIEARKLNIKGWHEMKKAELLEAVNSTVSKNDDDCYNERDVPKEIITKYLNNSKDKDFEEKQNKTDYISNAPLGTIVAFKTSEGKAKSAMIIARPKSRKQLKLVTEYGVEYIIPFSSVIWVKTGTKWPRYVFEMFKGNKRSESK